MGSIDLERSCIYGVCELKFCLFEVYRYGVRGIKECESNICRIGVG